MTLLGPVISRAHTYASTTTDSRHHGILGGHSALATELQSIA